MILDRSFESVEGELERMATILKLLDSLSEPELEKVLIKVGELIGAADGKKKSKLEHALEAWILTRTKILEGESLKIPSVKECQAYLGYYYLRNLKPGDKERVLNAYKPLIKGVRYRVKKRLAYHRRRGNLREYLHPRRAR